MKRLLMLCMAVFFIIIQVSNAKDLNTSLYSRISVSFKLNKIVKCDKLKARFEVYAEGDNYEMALKRLKKLNNNFLNFLRKHFANGEIQTSALSNYSKQAILYLTVDTNKPKKIQNVLDYIGHSSFEYKTGIRVVLLKPYISNKLKLKMENIIFKNAIVATKEKLKTVNALLNKGYKIKNIRINFAKNCQTYRENSQAVFYKSQGRQNINLSTGSKVIRAYITADFIKSIN